MIKKKAAAKKNSFSPAIIVAIAVLIVAVVVLIVAIALSGKENDHTISNSDISKDISDGEVQRTIIPARNGEPSGYVEDPKIGEYNEEHSYVMLEMDDGGKIVVELYPAVAPITVENFVNLVEKHFYDGLKIHRIVDEFVIQGGDPKGNGTGGSDQTITGEFKINGIENNLSHTRGVISMARNSVDYNSASSQFFIVLSDKYKSSLDGQYAGFGKVIVGMDVVDTIANVPKINSAPLEDVRIRKATVLFKAKEKGDSAIYHVSVE